MKRTQAESSREKRWTECDRAWEPERRNEFSWTMSSVCACAVCGSGMTATCSGYLMPVGESQGHVREGSSLVGARSRISFLVIVSSGVWWLIRGPGPDLRR